MNRFVRCADGHLHWGTLGAAGLLLAHDGTALLQLRARWTHHGRTWSVPGGAIERDETAVDTALREATEELGIDPGTVVVRGSWLATCGGWTYETVLAEPVDASRPPAVEHRSESAGHAWVAADDVADRHLHPGFRRAWHDDGGALRDFVRGTAA